MVFDDERKCHWGMIFDDNNGRVDGTKALLHANKWYVYNSQNAALVKGGYWVEVADKDKKKIIWEVVDDHVVEEGVGNEELGIKGFDFNLFDEYR